MSGKKAIAKDKSVRQEILRNMLASFRIEGIHISDEVAVALLKKIELRLERPRG